MLTWELPSASVMTSLCAGEVPAELRVMSLMMKSGLYHHPAGAPCPFSTCPCIKHRQQPGKREVCSVMAANFVFFGGCRVLQPTREAGMTED